MWCGSCSGSDSVAAGNDVGSVENEAPHNLGNEELGSQAVLRRAVSGGFSLPFWADHAGLRDQRPYLARSPAGHALL